MDRRTVLQGIGALVATPALPPLPAAASAAGHSTTQVLWGAHYARVHKTCNPDMIGSAFGWSKEVANSVFDQLVSDNVIRAPGASGLAKAVDPIDFDFSWSKSKASDLLEEAKDKLDLEMDDDQQPSAETIDGDAQRIEADPEDEDTQIMMSEDGTQTDVDTQS